ncbi:MAG: cytochrome c [Gemmatimonadota bacterium]
MAKEAGGGGGRGTGVGSRPRGLAARLARPALLAVAVPLLGGCTAFENAMARVSFLDFMKWSPAFSAYEHVRPVPPHSVPYITGTGDPYEPPLPAVEDSLEAFGDTAKNPMPMDSATIAMGKTTFDTYCFVCHGLDAHGHGPIVGPGKLPYAPDLTAETTIDRTDGYIYAVIRAGRGLMPSYDRIPPHLRWAVVDYVRHLQQQQQQQAGK